MERVDPGAELALLKVRLLDTGPLVAYLDPREESHEAVAESLERFTGGIATTSAVVTEAMHFVRRIDQGPRRLAELLGEADAEVLDLSRPADLLDAVGLMERYATVPMDFADATLVLLAETLASSEVFTLDRRGFSAYRTRTGRSFRIFP
jgi:predicted nucleic acid-binding protein